MVAINANVTAVDRLCSRCCDLSAALYLCTIVHNGEKLAHGISAV
jgi:hypothetical protein